MVSGQDRATVASHFEEIPRLGIVTDSGYAFRNAGEANIHSWETMDEHFDLSWVETVREIMQIYMLRTVGTYIERKKFAMLWRFADADPEYGALQVSEFISHCGLTALDTPYSRKLFYFFFCYHISDFQHLIYLNLFGTGERAC